MREAGVREKMAAGEDKGQSLDCGRNHVNDLDLLTFKGVLFTEKIRLNITTETLSHRLDATPVFSISQR